MSKTRDTGYLNNIIKYTESGNITFVNGNTTLLSISSSGAITTTGVISGSSAESAISASYAQVATSASFASTATSSSFASNAVSASQAQNAISSSFAANAADSNLLDGKDSTEFAITGSNIFTGTQYTTDTVNPNGFGASASVYTDGGLRVTKDAYVSGTMYVNNLTVFGTQSINYITSSQLNISTNIISVNTDTPSIRFGGLSVYDSGSTGLTGSILWDSERDHWVYSNPSGSSYSGGMLMSGPRASSLGNEQGTLNNFVMKGQGGDHITSSQIIDDGTTVRIPGNLQVTGSLSGSSAVLTGTLTGTSATFNGVLTATDGTQGLRVGAYFSGAGFGAIYSTGVTANESNFALAASSTQTFLNSTSNVYLSINGAAVLSIASSGATFASSVTGTTATFNGASTINLKLQNSANANTLFLIQSFGVEAAGENASILFKSAANATDSTYAKGLMSFRNNGTGYGRGDFYFSLNNGTDSANASLSDAKMVILANGNVGIGTTSPADRLYVTSAGFNVATFNSTYGQMSIGFANSGVGFAYIGSGNSVTSDGAAADDLGIGTGGLNKNIVFATGTGYTRRMTIGSTGTVTIAGITSVGELRIGDVYTQTYTTDASWSSSQVVVPNGVLANLATYMIEFDWDFGGVGGAPYLSSAAAIFRTNAYVNSGGDNNEVALATSSHVGGNYIIYMAMRAASGSTTAGVSARFSWTPAGSGGFIVVRVKRIG
jgi:hypothetical protein